MENETNNEVVKLYLCETEFLLLKPNVLYRFEVMEGCETCKELAESANVGN